MRSSSPSKKEDVGATPHTLNKSRCSVSLVPGPKPLRKHRFYLAVRNHITSSKLETKIKELGGLLEIFLVREVTHVVTDKEGWATSSSKGGGIHHQQPATTPRTPSSNQSSSLVRNEHGAPERIPNRGRPKTRADAMLERALKTPTIVSKDPLVQAKSWGITIWTVEKANHWLDKVLLATATAASKKRKAKVHELKAPYVKFEAFDRRHNPIFKEIRSWPVFNLRSASGGTGLVHKPIATTTTTTTTTTTGAGAEAPNMTRKSRAPHQQQPPRIEAAAQPGYCEVCRAEYPRLDEHLDSRKHLAFVKDNANFLDLDNLIADGSNIETFLKINDGSLLDDGRENKMPRTRTSSLRDKVKNGTPLSPTASELGHKHRTRRSAMTNSYIGSTADDDVPTKLEGAKEVRELRSTQRNALLKIAEQESDTWHSGRPKRSCIRQKNLLSDEDRVLLEARAYYKVEMSTKLRSSGPDIKPRPETPLPPVEPPRLAPTKKSLKLKFRRMRKSEIKQLNNEAENFLFPKREDDESSDEDVDANGPDTTASTGRDGSTLLLSSENDDKEEDDQSLDSNWSGSSNHKKKKRRLTHAEAFILDNKSYYKFETPGSRLRYQGSFMGTVASAKSPTRSNGDSVAPETKKVMVKKEPPEKMEVEDEDDGKVVLKDLKFSFERVPASEPWYQTFSRQDQGEEYYTCFSDSGYWKPFLLPYEMDPIPPLDPKVCMSSYSQLKKQIMDEVASSGTNSASCSTPESCEEDGGKATGASSEASSAPSSPHKKRGPKRKCDRPTPSKNPRKSPRQHASTLAILSSLIQQRKKRELNRSRNLETIPETETRERLDENEEMAKSIDDMLNEALEDLGNLDQIELCCKNNPVSMRFKSDAIEVLQDYENFKSAERKGCGGVSGLGKCFSPGKKPGRKKKKNRTGWPNKNRRLKKVTDCDEARVESEEDAAINVVVNKKPPPVVADQSSKKDSTVVVVNKRNSELNVQKRNSEDRVTNDWENADKVLAAKVSNDVNKDLQFQPYVRVQKLTADKLKANNGGKRRRRSSSSPHRTTTTTTSDKRQRRMPASPRSPRNLRRPRGRWYRER